MCDFRLHRECTCGPAECRVSPQVTDLGTFKKSVPLYRFTTGDMLAVVAVFIVSMAVCLPLLDAAERRVEVYNQEEITWQK